MQGIIIGVVLILLAGLVYWWIRRRRRTRLISFVALLREPLTFDPAVLAHIASKAWNADLGDGISEGADGFIAGAGIINTIFHGDRMFLINSFPEPYTPEVEKAAEGIADMRIRDLFCEHQAWFSCDALGVDGTTSPQEVLAWYQQLGKLFAELLDENCLLIFLPDSNQAFPINDETEAALRSEDPIEKLNETLTVPIVEVSADDAAMQKAQEKARQTWPEFVAAYEENTGENYSVKSPVTRNGNTEFIWISITAIEGEKIYGILGNEPHNLGSLRLGSKVSADIADLNDWGYINSEGEFIGGYTIQATQKASRQRRRR